MARVSIVFLALMIFSGVPAKAQPAVFFDDFDGDALLPHWSQYVPPQHNVSNSLLTITGLPLSNFGMLTTSFPQQRDFRVDVWMGWSSTLPGHRILFDLSGTVIGDPSIATFEYQSTPSGSPTITGTSYMSLNQYEWFDVAAPDPGIHQFTLTRTGMQIGFYMNGQHLSTLNGSGLALQRLTLLFYGSDSGEMSPLYVDRVQVVPAPGALIMLAGTALFCARRRRGAQWH